MPTNETRDLIDINLDHRISELEAENAALRVDAERYRYLVSCGMLCLNGVGFDSPESFSASIDSILALKERTP